MARTEHQGTLVDSPSHEERTGRYTHDEVRRKFGIEFEAENEEEDIERWRNATSAEFGQAIAELMDYGEAVVRVTGIRNEEPAPRFPRRRAVHVH